MSIKTKIISCIGLLSYLQEGNIPLFAAIKAGNLNITEELLKHKTEDQINFTNNALKDTALHLAAREQDNDMMRLFMKLGAGIDIQNVIVFFFGH